MQNKGAVFLELNLSKVAGWRAAPDFYGEQMKMIFGTVDLRATQVAQATAATLAATATNAKSVTTNAPANSAMPAFAALAVAAALALSTREPTEVNDMIRDGKDRFSAGLSAGVSEWEAEKLRETLPLGNVAKKGFDRFIYDVLITVAPGIGVALALIVLLRGYVTAPGARLAAAVDAMSRGQLDAPLYAGPISEFVGFEKALERMRFAQQAMVSPPSPKK